MELPLTRSPLEEAGYPVIWRHQSMTCSSTYAEECSPPPRFEFMPAASISASMASGVPVPMTQLQNRGW